MGRACVRAPARAETRAAIEAVDNHVLSFFPDLVRELGGNPACFLKKAGINPADFEAGRHRATYRQMVDLVALAATSLGCPDFGMRLAKRQGGHVRSPLVVLMESCETVGEALEQASKHSYAHSPVAAIWLRLSEANGRVLIGHDILLEGLSKRPQAMEQILLAADLAIREISGGAVRARRVQFRHQPISPLRVYRRFFGCKVTFDQSADALVLEQRDLAQPTAKFDEAAREAAIAQIDAGKFPRSPLHASVRGLIMHCLCTDRCRNAHVSRSLGLTVKAMHRRLAAEGTSFQRIKTDVRRDLALYHLEQTQLELASVSGRLGFAEQSALTYFCHKWLSASPSQIRSRAA